MISTSRVGGSPRLPIRFPSSFLKSGILNSRDASNRLNEFAPAIALRRQHLASGRGQPVIPATALTGFFDPAATNPAAFFQAIEQWIKRCDIEPKRAA